MAILSSAMVSCGTRLIPSSPYLISQGIYSRNNSLLHGSPHKNPLNISTHLRLPSHPYLSERKFSSRQRDISPVQCKANSSESTDGDKRALETVLKLFNAIKDRNIRELFDIIGDECRCVCNFFSFFEALHGKQQVLDFLNSVSNTMGKNIEFIVQPTLHHGMNVGIQWTLDYKKTHDPLGKGFSFYIFQFYQGRVLIRNVEKFMEPLLHIEPIRLKLMGYVMGIIDKMSSYKLSKDKVKKVMLALLFIATSILLIFLSRKVGSYRAYFAYWLMRRKLMATFKR